MNSYLDTIVKSTKNVTKTHLYIFALIVYCICIIVLFTQNPYNIITGNNEGFSIFLALFGGFLLIMMYVFYANKKDEIENNGQMSALSYLIRILSFIGVMGALIGVIYLLVKLGYYFDNVSYMLIYIVNWLILLGLLTMVVKFFQLDKSSSGESKPSWIRFIIQLITYIPCLILTFIDYIKHQYEITTRPIVMLFIAEIVFVIIYFILPIIIKEIITHNANLLLKDPININYENTLGSFGSVNFIKDKFQYHYAMSGWFYINSFPPETNANYSEYTSILNIGDKPNITFNVAKNTLKIKMKTEGHIERELFKTTNFKMQKWNNIVVNYDGNTLDIFINNELVSTTSGVIPYNSNTMITTGTTNGISGGVCNIMYFNNSISRAKIQWLYDSVKYLNPPVI